MSNQKISNLLKDLQKDMEAKRAKEKFFINKPKNKFSMKSFIQIIVGLFMVIGGVFGVAFLVFLAACISGTFLWAIYPHIFAFFPNAAKAGVLAPTLGWWDAVCVTWIFGLLLKPSSSSSSKKKDE